VWGALTLAAIGVQTAAAADTPGVVVDKEKRTVTIDAKMAPRKIDDPRYKEIYPLEVVACWAFPKGEKAHETVVTIECKPSDVHKALESLGLKPGKPENGGDKEPQGADANIYLEFKNDDGDAKRVSIEKTLVSVSTGKAMPKVKWRFTGSAMVKPDPNKDEEAYGADVTGTLIAIFPVTDKTVMQSSLRFPMEKYVKLETDKKLVPKEGTPVKLIIEVPESK
jgi:hypothetical protein